MSNKTTKRALVSSLLALILCMSMLLGTTFAWFTDSVTSGSNVIQAGNLDLEVEYTLDGENWADLNGAEDLFQKGLWEPGHTEVIALRISNKGSLALKYLANMNLVSETVGKNAEGNDIVLSEILTVDTLMQAANDAGEIALWLAFMGENTALAYESTVAFTADNILAYTETTLLPGDSNYVIIKVDMPETVGNEANYVGDVAPEINFGINVVATQYTYENDSFGPDYDKDAKIPVVVKNHDELQAALDYAVAGTTIQLMPGVDYGTLNVGVNSGATAVAGEFGVEFSTSIDVVKKKPVVINENTEAVNYIVKLNDKGVDTKYPTGEFVRKVEDLTIVGAPGATVDGFNFRGGVFKATGTDGTVSGSMYRFVEIKNLVIDSVEFTDKTSLAAATGFTSPIFIERANVTVDGLTVKNCKLNGEGTNMNFVYAYGAAMKDCSFASELKNVVIKDNVVSGISRLCELREAENVTIEGNVVSNLTREMALLGNNGSNPYSGDIVITGNTADNIASDYVAEGYDILFVRVGVAGDASITITGNTISNCPSNESTFARVTNHTGTLVIENNTLN